MNFQNVAYLYPTNAIADGVSDDTLSVSNAIRQLDNLSQPLTVLDLLGKAYGIYQPLPAIDRHSAQIRNGTLNFYSTNGTCLWLANTNTGTGGGNEYLVSHVDILLINNGSTPTPNTNSIGLLLGDLSNHYGYNCKVDNCLITNFWRGIEIASMAQTTLRNNSIYDNWSNDVYVVGGLPNPDMIWIYQNDINHKEVGGGFLTPAQAKNVIGIQCDDSCLDFRVWGNNGGGEKQAILCDPMIGAGVHAKVWGNEWETFENDGVHTNYDLFTFWNSKLWFVDNGYQGFNSSNYLADIGLYATNTSNVQPEQDYIDQVAISTKVDVWDYNNFTTTGSSCFVNTPQLMTEIIHNAWGDTGTAYEFTSGGSAIGYWGATNRIIISTAIFNQGANGEIDLFGGGNGGIKIFNTGNAVDFQTAGSVTFNNINTDQVLDRGGISMLQIEANFSHMWGLYSLNGSTLDLAGSNNVVWASAPIILSKPMTGVTNTAPANSTTPKLWVNYTNSLNGQTYMMPLYQ
jgi:parallel beta-helix repeat protein